MWIFRLSADAARYQTLTPVEPVPRIWQDVGRGRPLRRRWVPAALTLTAATAGRPPADYLAVSLSDSLCVFSERAVSCLAELLEPDGEFLPVACAGSRYYLYNCLSSLDHAPDPVGLHAFRMHTRGASVFVTGDVAERLAAFGLTGLRLEPVWVEPGARPVGCAPGDAARLAWECGLGYLQPFVAEHLAPAVRLCASPAVPGMLPVGASKLGGVPDLRADRPVPPVPFLAQINLADVTAPPLPPAGLLSFFDGDHPAVLYTEPGAPLVHAPAPAGPRPAERAVAAARILTLPPPDAPVVKALHLDSEDRRRYRTLVDAVARSYGNGPCHQLLGHPAASHALEPIPGGWSLLLQLDEGETDGQLCFWAPAADLAERRFDRVRLTTHAKRN